MADLIGSVCRIVVDCYEDRTVRDVLTARGVVVETRRLRVGDYVLPGGVLVERKTVMDFHLSVIRGRFWRQVAAARRSAAFAVLLVEGGSIDDGPLAGDAVRGVCLAVVGQGVALLRTDDQRDTARWLHLLARRQASSRCPRDRPVYGQRPRSREVSVPEAVIAAVPGISVVSARALLGRFGSVHGIAEAAERDLLRVPGIGPTRAEALHRALH